MKPASVTVPATPDFVRAAAEFVVQTARHLAVPAAASPLFEVAIVEALANAVKHGSRGREDATVSCEVERTDAGLSIRIYDEGQGFRPGGTREPLDPGALAIADVPESGYGVPIMRSVFHEIEARHEGGRFCLELKLASELPLA